MQAWKKYFIKNFWHWAFMREVLEVAVATVNMRLKANPM